METVARALLHGEEDLRRAAAEALANDPNEGHAMLKEGITLADILLRRAVVYGLARVDDEWAIESLQHIQVEDDQWVVRNSATEVIDSKHQDDLRDALVDRVCGQAGRGHLTWIASHRNPGCRSQKRCRGRTFGCLTILETYAQ